MDSCWYRAKLTALGKSYWQQLLSRNIGSQAEVLCMRERQLPGATWHPLRRSHFLSPSTTLTVMSPSAGDCHDQRSAGADGQDGECFQPCHQAHRLCCTAGLFPGYPSGTTQTGHQEEEERHPEVSLSVIPPCELRVWSCRISLRLNNYIVRFS